MDNLTHDFAGPIEKTSSDIAKKILPLIIENQEVLLMPFNPKATPEEQALQNEVATDFAIKVLSLISESDLPFDYATFPIEKIGTMLETLAKYINGTMRQNETELLSLTLGSKSPENGKYRKEVATVGELLLALNKAREDRGTTQEDYLNQTQQK